MTEQQNNDYGASNITVLEGLEAVRKRPGMYIGKVGDGSSVDDGIYILLKEIIDNCIDEFIMGFGKQINIMSIENLVHFFSEGKNLYLILSKT